MANAAKMILVPNCQSQRPALFARAKTVTLRAEVNAERNAVVASQFQSFAVIVAERIPFCPGEPFRQGSEIESAGFRARKRNLSR